MVSQLASQMIQGRAGDFQVYKYYNFRLQLNTYGLVFIKQMFINKFFEVYLLRNLNNLNTVEYRQENRLINEKVYFLCPCFSIKRSVHKFEEIPVVKELSLKIRNIDFFTCRCL